MDGRSTLQRVATHVLARRRHQVTGRFGLRVTPGGIGTPAFGDEVDSVRLTSTHLVRETVAGASYREVEGSTLRDLASVAGADVEADFSAGSDTTPLGDVDAPLTFDTGAARAAFDWFSFGWQALDSAVAVPPADAAPAVLQLWPEHFDIGTNIGVGGERRTNLGASIGDADDDEPYLYVGPWGDERPGDPSFWNAPFGARLRRSDLHSERDPLAAAIAFLTTGVSLLRDGG